MTGLWGWAKSYYWTPISIVQETAEGSISTQVLVNRASVVQKLAFLGLGKERVLEALDSGRLLELMVECKARQLLERLPRGSMTEAQAYRVVVYAHRFEGFYRRRFRDTGEEMIGVLEPHLKVIFSSEGRAILALGELLICLNTMQLLIQKKVLSGLGLSEVEINLIQSNIYFHAESRRRIFRGGLPSSPVPISLEITEEKILKGWMVSNTSLLLAVKKQTSGGSKGSLDVGVDVFSGALYMISSKSLWNRMDGALAPQSLAMKKDIEFERYLTVQKALSGIDGIIQLRYHMINSTLQPRIGAVLNDHMLVTDYYNLGDLQGCLGDRFSYFNRAQILSIARQLIDTVTSIHARGFVHRSITPENILVHRRFDGSIRVAFNRFHTVGLAESSPSLIERDLDIAYVSPDYARALQSQSPAGQARALGPSFDVWSLGVVLIQLFTNKSYPFVVTEARKTNEERTRPLGRRAAILTYLSMLEETRIVEEAGPYAELLRTLVNPGFRSTMTKVQRDFEKIYLKK